MQRSILVVQALALVAASCRSDAQQQVANQEGNASSGNVSLVTVATGQGSDAGQLESTQQNAGDSNSADAATTLVQTVEPVDSGIALPLIVTDRPARGVAIATVAQCSRSAPENAACTRLDEMCGGGQSHCMESRNPRVPPRCGATQWHCRCRGTTTGLAWHCDVAMHPAGPLAPPELAS